MIGGYTLGVYSEPRATKDLDVFIRADQENSEAILRALVQFGAPMEGYSGKLQRPFHISNRAAIGSNRHLQAIDGIYFEEAWPNRVSGLVDGDVEALVISKEDLRRNKIASCRDRDLLDVKALRKSSEAEEH